MPHSNEFGFTLFELLITLALLAIVGMITMPALAHMVEANRQQVVFDQLHSAIQDARSRAVLDGQRIELCASQDGKTCRGEWSRGWIMRIIKTEQILGVTTLPESDSPLRWSGFSSTLRFHPNGTSPLSNGRFFQCNKQQIAWQLIMNRQGRVRSGTSQDNAGESARCS